MDEVPRRSLIECFHDEAEILVSIFLSRLGGQESSEFLQCGPQRRSLLTVSVSLDKALLQGF